MASCAMRRRSLTSLERSERAVSGEGRRGERRGVTNFAAASAPSAVIFKRRVGYQDQQWFLGRETRSEGRTFSLNSWPCLENLAALAPSPFLHASAALLRHWFLIAPSWIALDLAARYIEFIAAPVGRVGRRLGGRRVIRVEGRGRRVELEEVVGVTFPFREAAEGPRGGMEEEEEKRELLESGRGWGWGFLTALLPRGIQSEMVSRLQVGCRACTKTHEENLVLPASIRTAGTRDEADPAFAADDPPPSSGKSSGGGVWGVLAPRLR